MKFLIAGLGSIGRRHLKNLLELGQKDIVLYRTHQSTLGDEGLQGFPVEQDIQKALSHKPDAVIISNPTALHMEVAVPAAESGCALFIEKPLASTPDDLQQLESILEEKGNIVFSAFQFRFNPGLRKIDQLLSDRYLGSRSHLSVIGENIYPIGIHGRITENLIRQTMHLGEGW